MKTPKRLLPLIEDDLVDEVIRPLMSGKEADVYIVRCGEDMRCAKVYKDAERRSFKQAVHYEEGRKGRNSRRGRAMQNRSKFGRKQQEEEWHTSEVDALYLLTDADVRVPRPYGLFDGVLLMELVTDADGQVAPRLNDISLDTATALQGHDQVIRYVVRMLSAGLVHGDLSEFNILVDQHGPVIIDLPQAVDAAANNHAQWMLERDVNNVTAYYGIYAPELLNTKYAKEMWALYETGKLHPEIELKGQFKESTDPADVDSVLENIEAVVAEEQERRQRLGVPGQHK
jgi:RIO kinase 1